MRKFISEIVFYFLLPMIGIAFLAEYSIRQLPNEYRYKNNWLETNGKDLSILCLGPSSVYYGINPVYFDKKAFNGAHVSQTLDCDNFIFNKHVAEMDSLRYLILGIDFWSPYTSIEHSREWWRVNNYVLYYGLPKEELKYNYEMSIHNVTKFKRAAKGFLTKVGIRNDSEIKVNQLGYGLDYARNKRTKDWDNGLGNAQRHNKEIENLKSLHLIQKNKEYVTDIVKKCAAKNIKVLLITPPTYTSYLENLNKGFLKEKNEFCTNVVKGNANAVYLDFSGDPRFVEEDFYDGYHLNDLGAKKFTTVINAQIKNDK